MKYNLSSSYKLECAESYFAKLKEKKAWIELKEIKVPHSIDSHRLYWVWLNCIAKETGRDKNELHYLYRATYLPRAEDEILKIIKPEVWVNIKRYLADFRFFNGMDLVIDIISESTAISMNNNPQDDARFSQYLKEIRNHARVNFNVILLTIDDQNFIEFYKEFGFI